MIIKRGPIHINCPTCDKVAVVKSESILGQLRVIVYECGHVHTEFRKVVPRDVYENFTTLTGKQLFKFQVDGALFIQGSGVTCLVADEMGLGKTMQFLSVMREDEDAVPFLVLCKSTLKLQWFRAILEWCGDSYCSQIIDMSREKLYKGFKSYIIPMDLLRRFDIEELLANIEEVGIKTVVIDECQHIKNSNSQRTGVVRKVCSNIKNVVGMSGTPIKNHAGEYFSILNILRPDKFPSNKRFLWDWVDVYDNGYQHRIGGLVSPKDFKDFTSDFIIRRERKEVMPDLPLISRRNQFCDLGSTVEKAYKKAFLEFKDYYDHGQYTESNSLIRQTSIMAFLSKMRQLTGIAKVDQAVDFTSDFLDETDRKLTIFVHHITVGVALKSRISELCSTRGIEAPLTLTSTMNSDARDQCVTNFTTGPHRILIASTLASGEGLNLQACSDCIMLERQWNPANEEQAESRFIRIGQEADSVFATYIIAIGTIDEFFSELVERKREIVNSTMGGESVHWDESSIIQELSSMLAENGGKKWGW